MVDLILRKLGSGERRSYSSPDIELARSIAVSMRITNVQSLDIPFDSPVTTIELPEQKAEENLQIKISGNSASATITWRLGIDENTSPFISGVNSLPTDALDIAEAIAEYMVSSSIDNAGYQLVFPNDWTINGHVDNFTFHIGEDAPEVLLCTMRMTIGKALISLDVDDSSEQGDDTS